MKAFLLSVGFTLALSVSAQYYTPPSDLIGYWNADGNAMDNVGGHNGALYGTTTYGAGIHGQAFDFTRSAAVARVRVEDAPVFATPSFTLTGWVNARTWNGQVLVRGDSRYGLDSYVVNLYTPGSLNFYFNSAANESVLIRAPFQLNEWSHFAASFDDATGVMALYINGVLRAETITPLRPVINLSASHSPGIGFGNVPETSNNFTMDGRVDEIGIYSRALSAAEIAAIVPEPNSLALLFLGMLGIVIRRKAS